MTFRRTLLFVVLCLVLPAGAASCLAQKPGTPDSSSCAGCHDVDKKLQTSAHASLPCQTCHPKHEDYPHPEGIAKPACGSCHTNVAADDRIGVHGIQRAKGNGAAPECGTCHGAAHELSRTGTLEFRKGVPETCGMCHDEVAKQFSGSVHGQALARGVREAPVCTDCHGEHSIVSPKSAASPVSGARLSETCGRCHGDVRLARKYGLPADRIVSFQASFHGLAARAGSQTVANCASCHGIHNILQSSDPKSMIHPANLPQTCGKCHPGAGQRFAIGQVHLVQGRAEAAPLKWIRIGYQILIPLLIGLMLLHNAGDWIRKVVRYRLSRRSATAVAAAGRSLPGLMTAFPAFRMYRTERIQHVLLVTSFFTLVWTGFALKYPDVWWARPLLAWESAWPMRGIVHRVAAGVFMGVTALHLAALIMSPRLREHWKSLWPRRADVVEAIQNFFYNVGLSSHRPTISSHAYVEKAEYWAVVWGAVIMIITGVMLWANNFMLSLVPKVWLDVATSVHFYEALLATLAIVVWHLYSTIFDPEVYPIDPAWLTGYSVRKLHREFEEHPDLVRAATEAAADRSGAVQAPAAPEAHTQPAAGTKKTE